MKRFVLTTLAGVLLISGCSGKKGEKKVIKNVYPATLCSEFLASPETNFPKYLNSEAVVIKGNVSLNKEYGGKSHIMSVIALPGGEKEMCAVDLQYSNSGDYQKAVTDGIYKARCKFKTAVYKGGKVFGVPSRLPSCSLKRRYDHD